MSSINDAQSTCSNYTKALDEKELEVANMNIQFQNISEVDEISQPLNTFKYYKLQYIIGKGQPPKYEECTIIVDAYLGNGMNEEGATISNLYISKDTNMNINSKDDNKTLGACNVLRTVIETIRSMWTNYFELLKIPGNPLPTPEIISKICWDSMLTKYNYYNFLKCSHLKALGDSTQELNGALKYGGYTSAGKRTYKDRIIYYINGVNTNDRIPYEAASGIEGNISPFDENGDGYRATLSNDRQAGSRSVWLLTCLPDEVVNQNSIGGYSGPGANKGNYVLASVRKISDRTEKSANKRGRKAIGGTLKIVSMNGGGTSTTKTAKKDHKIKNDRKTNNDKTSKKGGKIKKSGKKTRKMKRKTCNNIFLF